MAVLKRKKDHDFLENLDDLCEKFGKKFPIDVEAILKEINIELSYDNSLNSEESGYIYYNKNNNKWCIGVNSTHAKNRQRFTIAHELGHFMLHKLEIEKKEKIFDAILFRRGEISPMEKQANEFASQLLMPAHEFRKQVQVEKNTTISELANYFGVSTLAVRYRAKNLGYGGHGV